MNNGDELIAEYRRDVEFEQRPRVRTRPGSPARERCSYCYCTRGFTSWRHLRGCEVLLAWAELVFAQRARNRGAYDVGEWEVTA